MNLAEIEIEVGCKVPEIEVEVGGKIEPGIEIEVGGELAEIEIERVVLQVVARSLAIIEIELAGD